MTISLVLDFPGANKQQYDEVVARMHLDGEMEDGGRLHFAGSYGDGWRVIDIWESLEQFERFRDDKIIPITQEVGMGPPKVRLIEVAGERAGSGQPPELVQCAILPGLDAVGFAEADAKVIGDGIPAEISFHVNGPLGNDWCVIDGWTSKAARDELIETKVRPAVEGMLSGPPQVEDLIAEAMMGSGLPATA